MKQPTVPSPPQSAPWPPSDLNAYAQAYQTQTGLFRNFMLTGQHDTSGQSANVTQISMTNVSSASRRPMIAESAYDIVTLQNGTPLPAIRDWTQPGRVPADHLGFLWLGPTSTPTVPGTPIFAHLDGSGRKVGGVLLPIHTGIVNITFCDGHTEGVADDPTNVCGNYDWSDISTYP